MSYYPGAAAVLETFFRCTSKQPAAFSELCSACCHAAGRRDITIMVDMCTECFLHHRITQLLQCRSQWHQHSCACTCTFCFTWWSEMSLILSLMPLQMQKIPDLEKLNIKDITSYGGATQHGEERAKKHDKAASLYNHVSCRLLICSAATQECSCHRTHIVVAKKT